MSNHHSPRDRMITLPAPGKLNLALHITGRRADGYHLLESLVAFTQWGDTLTLEPADALALHVSGDFAEAAGNGADNLALRAAQALQQYAFATTGKPPQGARITLSKNIPVGAGLGGGSADAAAVLRGLEQLWNLHVPTETRHAIALSLGADVPMCLQSTALIARGIGEELTPLAAPLPPMHVVLVHPYHPLLSADVYCQLNYSTEESRPISSLAVPVYRDTAALMRWLAEHTRNDLQRSAITVSPVVAQVLLAMETALPTPHLVRMTGSGACCFALFTDAPSATRFASNFAAEYPQWWVKKTSILS